MAPGLAIDPLFFRWVGRGLFGGISIFCTLQTHRKTLLFLFCSFSFFFIYLRNPRGPMSRIGFKSQIDRREKKKKKTKQKLFRFLFSGQHGKEEAAASRNTIDPPSSLLSASAHFYLFIIEL
jgi:hypothetical protein